MAVENYLKILEDGSTVATKEKPSFGEVSSTADYYLNGLWYDKTGVEYETQFTYASKDGKLLSVLVEDGQPVDYQYNHLAPSIVEDSIQAKRVIQTENRIMFEIGTIYNNQRLVYDNPFGNENYMDCEAKIEIYFDGIWFNPYIGNNSGTGAKGYGAMATATYDGIVVQTGVTGLKGNSNTTGDVANSTGTFVSAPARIIVTYNGKTKEI